VTTADLGWLWDVLEERRGASQEDSYTARLLAGGVERIGRKVGEEATETVIAAVRVGYGENRAELIGESADLVYHLLVLLLASGVGIDEVIGELERRHADR
jgi:phosphoribosyl-ATP pyrophosphohydrolase